MKLYILPDTRIMSSAEDVHSSVLNEHGKALQKVNHWPVIQQDLIGYLFLGSHEK